jgi:hypothetical protein
LKSKVHAEAKSEYGRLRSISTVHRQTARCSPLSASRLRFYAS